MFCGIAYLWEKITAIGYPWFYKTTPFLSLKGKSRVKLIHFFWYSPLFGMRQKTAKNQWNCIVLNFNQIQASLFQYKFKYLSHKEHIIAFYIQPQIIFFSFDSCPIGITLMQSGTIQW